MTGGFDTCRAMRRTEPELPDLVAGLEARGLPHTVAHGDFHPGNWMSTGTAPPSLTPADGGMPGSGGFAYYALLPRGGTDPRAGRQSPPPLP